MNGLARGRVHIILAAALVVLVAVGLAVAGSAGRAAAATGPGVFGWGWNARGETGTLGTSAIGAPSPLIRLTAPVRQLASDEVQTDESAALLADGTVNAWGANGYGGLGDGTVWGSNAWGLLGNGSKSGQSATPAAVPGLTGITQIAVSTLDALAIAGPSRTVWAWGYNAFGEIGNGTDRTPQLRPVLLAVTGAVQVAEVFGASAAVLSDGRLMVWGANSDYGLGIGTAQAGQVYPVQNPFLSGVSQVALGFEVGLAIGFSKSARVPDVRSDDLPAASTALKAAGFVLGAVSYTGVCSNPDRVVAQTPPAGAFAMIGSAVSMAVGRLKLCLQAPGRLTRSSSPARMLRDRGSSSSFSA